MNTYIPIDCNFYDRILEASTLKQSVELVYQDEEIRTVMVKIQDVYTTSGEEFLKTSAGLVIRLDQIVRLGNHFLPEIDQFGQHYNCLRPIAIT
jgi:transcriptional antiterminator Rof (Rho-off)